MDQFAIGIMASIEMRTISKAFIRILVDNGSKVFTIAETVSFGLLAFVTSAVITVFQIALTLELCGLNLLFIASDVLQLN